MHVWHGVKKDLSQSSLGIFLWALILYCQLQDSRCKPSCVFIFLDFVSTVGSATSCSLWSFFLCFPNAHFPPFPNYLLILYFKHLLFVFLFHSFLACRFLVDLLIWSLSPRCCLASEAQLGPNRAVRIQQTLEEAPNFSLRAPSPQLRSSPLCLSSSHPCPSPSLSPSHSCSLHHLSFTPLPPSSNCSHPLSSNPAMPALPAM